MALWFDPRELESLSPAQEPRKKRPEPAPMRTRGSTGLPIAVPSPAESDAIDWALAMLANVLGGTRRRRWSLFFRLELLPSRFRRL
jgi:hypothetical protein